MKQPMFLENLPDDFGSGSLRKNHDFTKRAGRTALRYASITSLVLSLATIAMAVV